jgi:haloalkane dehalogenase
VIVVSSSNDQFDGEYPFVGRSLDLDGLRYHYVDEGNGPVVLFVHGNPTWSFAWRNFIKSLRGSHRCIAVDHIGCGRSEKPQDYDYTLANHVSNLTRLIDELDLQEITLVGHDWGGCIGMGAAVRRPERFDQFVLANTAAFRSQRVPLRIAVCRVPVLGKIAVRGFNGFAGAAQWMAVARRLPPVVRRGYLAPYDSWANRIATHEFVRDIPMDASHRSYQTLVEIEAGLDQFADRRILLCWGERDWCFTTDFLADWERRFPHAEVERYPQASHYVFEDAGEAMIARVGRFLDEQVNIERPTSNVQR